MSWMEHTRRSLMDTFAGNETASGRGKLRKKKIFFYKRGMANSGDQMLRADVETPFKGRLLNLSRAQLTLVLADLKFQSLEEARANEFDDEQLLLYANDILHLDLPD